MALEGLNYKTLKSLVIENYPEEYNNFLKYVYVDIPYDTLKFEFQTGPRKEIGVNGVQIDLLILIFLEIIRGLNERFPSDENIEIINHSSKIIELLKERTKNRTEKGIEGLNK